MRTKKEKSNLIKEQIINGNEERYRIFLDSTPDMAFLKDDKFKYILVNKANAKFFEKKIYEIIGKTDFELMPEEFAKNCRLTDEKAIKSDSIIISEESIGDKIYETHKFKVPLSGGKFGVGGYVRDITERKWAEENLKKSEEHYRTLLTAIPDLMFRLDKEGRFIDYHADDISILFAPPEKFLGKNYKEILPPDIADKYEKTIKKIKKTGGIGKFEYEALIKDNELHYYEASVTCYGDECVSIIRDVSEQKKSENALKGSEERYRLLIESMSEGVLRGDVNDTIMFANKSACEIFGYEHEELIGRIGYEILIIEEDRHIIRDF